MGIISQNPGKWYKKDYFFASVPQNRAVAT